MSATHETAIHALRMEILVLSQAARCSRDDAERERLTARIADLEHSILALGLAEAAQPRPVAPASTPEAKP